MKEEDREWAIRRILVALDSSRHSLAALKAAAELATRLKAELIGLFVEDINLLRLAGLPFAREIRYPSAVIQEMESSRLERELKVQAAQARQALMTAAEQAQVAWSFRVVRGQVTAEVLAAALEADLLSLGIASGPATRRGQMGSTARTVAVEAPRAVLLLQQGEKIRGPILVTYDGSPAARQALAMAVHLAQTTEPVNRLTLTVLILAGEEMLDTAQRLEREVTAWLAERGLQANCRRLTRTHVSHLAQVVQAEQGGLLVLNGPRLSIQIETIQALLDQIDCPILLVRSSGEQ
ncbi:MAG: universal stress protein [Anaerolineae bacterium]|nr:universal stress protein [Anaerolineales bacterium]MCQ3976733.1 universal stress protein [Anaerolineae bacterium]